MIKFVLKQSIYVMLFCLLAFTSIKVSAQTAVNYTAISRATSGLAADSAGNVYAASISVLYKIAPNAQTTSIVGSALVNNCLGIVYNRLDGSFYLSANSATMAIHKVSAGGFASSFYSSPNAASTALAVDALSNIYGICGDGTIIKITPGGTATTFASGLGTPSNLYAGLAIDAAGNLYAGVNSKVYKITPAGLKSTLCTLSLSGTYIKSLSVDASGNVYAGGNFYGIYKATATGTISYLSVLTTVNDLYLSPFDASGSLHVLNNYNVLASAPIYKVSDFCTPTTATVTATACGSYTWHGTTYTSSNNTATFDSLNAAGCDSLTTLNLTINQPTTSTTTLTNCGSYTWNGQTYITSGTYTKTFTGGNAAGCDSTATLVLTVKANSNSLTTANVCSAALPYTWNGRSYSTNKTDTVHFTNSVGCDSAAIINFGVIPQQANTTTYYTSCGSYLWHGTTYTTSGRYTYTVVQGAKPPSNSILINCVDTAILYLTVNQPTTKTLTQTACTSYTWHGSTYTSSGTYTFDSLNAAGCDSLTTLNLTINNCTPNYTWTGTTSTDWSVATNWTNNTLPTSGVTVTIPSAPSNQPALSTDISIAGIVLNGTVAINGHSFTITGAVSGTGFIKGSNSSSLTVNSGSSNTISFGSTGTDSLLANLTNSGSGTLTLGTGVGITTLLSVTSGTLNTGNHLTLKSTSIANTAVVGVVSGTITGKVTVERYIPQGNRAFRDLGAEVANSGAILNNWQEGGNSPAGYGIYITGVKGASPGGVDVTTGLDKTQTGNPSLYTYGAGSWPSVTNTRTNSLDPFMGYRASIRGDRTYNIYAPDPGTMINATTLRATGNLVTGNVVYNTTNVASSVYTSTAAKLISGLDNYSFVANPYDCPIDWEAVYANGGTTNLTASYWYFDPTFMSNGYATYVTYNAVSHVNSNHPTSKLDRYIQPGMAFFVQNSSSSNPTLSITESNKAPNSTKTAVYGVSASPNYLQVSLWKNINGVNTNIDGAVAVFNNNFTKVIGDKDSKKLANGGENLYITQSNTDLSIAGLPMPSVNDEIVLNLNQVVAGTNYQLQLDASQFAAAGIEAFIKDKLFNTVVPAFEGISFTPTKDASTYEGRFSIVFKATDVTAANSVKQIAVYPNPVTGNLFNIQMGSLEKGTYKVIVVNALGKEVLNNTIQHTAGASVETIHTNTLIPGIYTVTIQGKTTVCHTEMIIGK